MTDTKDVAYVRERLCKVTDVFDEIFVKTKEISEENAKLKEQVKHLSKTQARQFRDNQRLQVKAEKAKDVVNIDTARQIKQLKELLKECRENIASIDYEDYNSPVLDREQSILLNKINQVLGEE